MNESMFINLSISLYMKTTIALLGDSTCCFGGCSAFYMKGSLMHLHFTFSRRFYPKRLTYVRLTMYTHFTFYTSEAIRGSVSCSRTRSEEHTSELTSHLNL